MAFYTTIYNTIFKRNSIFVGTIMFGTFLFQPAFEASINKFWEHHNRGKLWKDVKAKLGDGDAEEEEDDE